MTRAKKEGGLNVLGVELSFRVSVLVTLLALAVLAIFWASAIVSGQLDFSRWALNIGVTNEGKLIELPEGGGPFLPLGINGILTAMPFAVWLYLAIEQLPLPFRNTRRAITSFRMASTLASRAPVPARPAGRLFSRRAASLTGRPSVGYRLELWHKTRKSSILISRSTAPDCSAPCPSSRRARRSGRCSPDSCSRCCQTIRPRRPT